MAKVKILNVALCDGRHEIPAATDGAVYPSDVDPVNLNGLAELARKKLGSATKVNLYVTGLTVAVVEIIKVCWLKDIPLTLFHYNRDNGQYYPQHVWELDDEGIIKGSDII